MTQGDSLELLEEARVRGYPQEHRHLTGVYTTEENVSPSTETQRVVKPCDAFSLSDQWLPINEGHLWSRTEFRGQKPTEVAGRRMFQVEKELVQWQGRVCWTPGLAMTQGATQSDGGGCLWWPWVGELQNISFYSEWHRNKWRVWGRGMTELDSCSLFLP